MPGSPPSASTQGLNHRRRPAGRMASAAAFALIARILGERRRRFLPAQAVQVRRPRQLRRHTSASNSRISRSLPALCVAMTILPVICAMRCLLRAKSSGHRQLLHFDQLARRPCARAPASWCSCASVKGGFRPLRRCPGSGQMPPVAGHDEIGVRMGLGDLRHNRDRAPASPLATPQEIAATLIAQHFAASMIARPSSIAGNHAAPPSAPVIEAVRVPPSAWITSQSMVIWRSPSAYKIDDRRAGATEQALDFRPCGRPACRRWLRGACARGSRAAAWHIRR